MHIDRLLRRGLILIALAALCLGLLMWGIGSGVGAKWIWALGTIPVAAGLLVSMIRDFLLGRVGVDAIAFVSMSAALLLGETLAAVVVAVMYAGGNVLEDFAVTRAERGLKSLVDRAPRIAHRAGERGMEDVAIETVAVGDALLVRAGEIIPVDGVIISPIATLDESALTGEPIPINRRKGEAARSGTLNAGETFEMRVSATAGESTYAGIVRLVTTAQTAKGPFIRPSESLSSLVIVSSNLLLNQRYEEAASIARWLSELLRHQEIGA
jgi:cation transport ATPase